MVIKQYAVVTCGAMLCAFRTSVVPGCSVCRESCMNLWTGRRFELLKCCNHRYRTDSPSTSAVHCSVVPIQWNCCCSFPVRYSTILKPTAAHPHCVCWLYLCLTVAHCWSFNPFKSSGHYMYHQFNIQQFYVLFTQCIYVFCVDLGTISYSFPLPR
jgi:hypothetical protein